MVKPPRVCLFAVFAVFASAGVAFAVFAMGLIGMGRDQIGVSCHLGFP